MEKCVCQRDGDIAFLKTKVRDFDRDLNGNGIDGIKKEVNTLTIEHESEMKDLAKLTISYEKLARTTANREAVLKFVGRSIVTGSLILGGAAAITAVIVAIGF